MLNKERGKTLAGLLTVVQPPGLSPMLCHPLPPRPKGAPCHFFLDSWPAVCFPFPEVAAITPSLLDIFSSKNGCWVGHNVPCSPSHYPLLCCPFWINCFAVSHNRETGDNKNVENIKVPESQSHFSHGPWSVFLIPLVPFPLSFEGRRWCNLLSPWCFFFLGLLTLYCKYLTSRELRDYSDHYIEEKGTK